MSFTGPSVGSAAAGRAIRRTFEFGRTYVVRPKGKHQATVVWLHGLGDNGNSWSTLLETLPLPNIKWICPTAPQQPITLFGGFPSTAWFDVNDLSENANDDLEGLDASAAYVASLLANEPPNIKLGVGGFSMGAATSLYSATCFVHGKYGNGNQYSANLTAVVGLSGWLPCAKNLRNKIDGVEETAGRASLPILLCHGRAGFGPDMCKHLGFTNSSLQPTIGLRFVVLEFIQVLKSMKASWDLEHVVLGICMLLDSHPCYISHIFREGNSVADFLAREAHSHRTFKFLMLTTILSRGDDVVSHKFGEKSSEKLSSYGFQNVIFKSYPGLGHYTIPEEMDEVCAWLISKLGLEGQ